MAAANLGADMALTSNVKTRLYEAGGAIAANRVVVLGATDSKVYEEYAQDAAYATTNGARTVVGVSVNAAQADGDYVVVAYQGTIDPGTFTEVVGATYYLTSDTAQLSEDVADVDAGDYVYTIGYATADGAMVLAPTSTGVVKA